MPVTVKHTPNGNLHTLSLPVVYDRCEVEIGDLRFSVSHGEYILDVVNCSRCLCEDGEAVFCESAGNCDLIRGPQSCEFEGQEIQHGETFEVSACMHALFMKVTLGSMHFFSLIIEELQIFYPPPPHSISHAHTHTCSWIAMSVAAVMVGFVALTGDVIVMMEMMTRMTARDAGRFPGVQSVPLTAAPTALSAMPSPVPGDLLKIFYQDLAPLS